MQNLYEIVVVHCIKDMGGANRECGLCGVNGACLDTVPLFQHFDREIPFLAPFVNNIIIEQVVVCHKNAR